MTKRKFVQGRRESGICTSALVASDVRRTVTATASLLDSFRGIMSIFSLRQSHYKLARAGPFKLSSDFNPEKSQESKDAHGDWTTRQVQQATRQPDSTSVVSLCGMVPVCSLFCNVAVASPSPHWLAALHSRVCASPSTVVETRRIDLGS